MRLSEAIRIGAGLGPQAFGTLNRTKRKYWLFGPAVNEYCALGAAFQVGGAREIERTITESSNFMPFRGNAKALKVGSKTTYLDHPWTRVTWLVANCPACDRKDETLFRLIPHLNDDHRFTREAIADFIEPIEIAHEQQQEASFREWAEADESSPEPDADQFLSDLKASIAQPLPVEERL